MSPPTRTDFLRSSLYRCALAFNKRNEQRLKTLQELLERADERDKRTVKSKSRKKYISSFVLPNSDDKVGKNRTSKEDQAILSADKDKTDWIFDGEKDEYTLNFGGVTVLKVPTDMYNRLKPFQRDAVKWIASVTPIGGVLADDMGKYDERR